MARRESSTLSRVTFCLPIACAYLAPPILRPYRARTGDLSPWEELLLESSLGGLFAIFGWWFIPVLLLMTLSTAVGPLALYHFVLEVSPLRASFGKVIQGYFVVTKRGDPITISNALRRLVDRVMILPHLLGHRHDFDIVRRGVPRVSE